MKTTTMSVPYTSRQRWRRIIQFTSLVLFPVFVYYLSPILCIVGVTQRIVVGSVIVFGAQFVASLFFGRLFCGWVCPAGAAGEMVGLVQRKPVRRRVGWIKSGIWAPWVGFLLYGLLRPGEPLRVSFGEYTTSGISVVDLQGYIIYYLVLTAFVALALVLGRRGGCHTICWMAPFMVLGRWVRNLAGWPALRLRSERANCIECGRCSEQCPMSINVQTMVARERMEDRDCILCGNCVDTCPRSVIRYSFSSGSRA
jgi:polyferredoxin